jgi:hypothetical protein
MLTEEANDVYENEEFLDATAKSMFSKWSNSEDWRVCKRKNLVGRLKGFVEGLDF